MFYQEYQECFSKRNKRKERWWHWLVVPATLEDEAEESLEPSIGNIVEP
jgi:hypothetical protein